VPDDGRHSTIPIYASAVSQKMTALCGEIADGIILTRSTLATAAVVREQLAEGARRAGGNLDQIIVTTLMPAAVGETRREALDARVLPSMRVSFLATIA
jgi:alkanesulfonate monooxygenase SsuD/methylene tetrahydromethanopterin reductase-like flavin-dependent oxidoreductase (luciferase family)